MPNCPILVIYRRVDLLVSEPSSTKSQADPSKMSCDNLRQALAWLTLKLRAAPASVPTDAMAVSQPEIFQIKRYLSIDGGSRISEEMCASRGSVSVGLALSSHESRGELQSMRVGNNIWTEADRISPAQS
jgi:hypothetical protein